MASNPIPLESRADIYRSGSETHSSGVSWGAVTGGAFVAAALSLILLALGAGLGLSSLSPWSAEHASGSSVGTVALVWLVFVEIVASAMGGYLTGRLRVKWATVHTDEVYFRDTANGFLAWAVAVVITVSFLASGAAAMAGNAAQAGDEARLKADSTGYLVDTLFRSDKVAEPEDGAAQLEAERILGNALKTPDISSADRQYLSGVIVAKTGIPAADADKRISDAVAAARQTLDDERKAAARLLLWTFFALLMGAFSASYAATIGGRQRDHVRLV